MATEKKRIILNAFDMTCVSHQSTGMWRHPSSQAARYNDLEYWTNMAIELERGHFDTLFIADVVGVYDVYRGSGEAALKDAAQVPVNDPFAAIAAMAAVTKHVGFGVTAAVTYEHPYLLARRLSTLDHLTKGRVAWNVVSSYLNSAAVNLGMDKQMTHDQRYDMADEYMEVIYKLWEGAGRIRPSSATRSAASLPMHQRSIRSGMRANISRCPAFICASPRRSARR